MNFLSVLICTMNRANMLEDVLICLKNQTLNKSLFEVLVLDQSTNNDTTELLNKYPEFNYIKLQSKGISASRNAGLEHSKGDLLVFVDDDVTFENNYLEKIVEFFNTSPLKPDMVGGKNNLIFLSEKPEWLDGPLLNILAFADFANKPSFYQNHPKHVPYTCNAAVKKECAIKTGGFINYISEIEPKFALNDDVMFANKIRNAGYNVIYNPDMVINHKIPTNRLTYKSFKEKYYAHGRSDAIAYYILGLYDTKEIPFKLITHLQRLIEGFFMQFFKTIPSEKYYQKLRIPYNAGAITGLLKVLTTHKKIKKLI